MMESFTLDPAVLWFIVGIVLIIAEFAVPGLVIVFFGVAALLVSLLTWMGILDETSSQLLVFSIASLVLLFGLRWLVKDWFVGRSARNEVSDETSDIVGHEVRCLTAFSGETPYGKVEFKGANWKAHSDLPLTEGDYATIVSIDGLCLNIKPR